MSRRPRVLLLGVAPRARRPRGITAALSAQTGTRTANGGPTAAISAARATRRSTRSTADNFRAGGRVALQDRHPRPPARLQPADDAADGERRAVHDGRLEAHAVAIDAATGELLWMYRLDEGKRAAASPRPLSGRGVAYWTDGKGDERIFFVTVGYQLVALDAKTGHAVRGLRRERHRRPEAEQRPGPRSDHRRDRAELARRSSPRTS